eukprot:8470042-Pyramimonas_sp.AAC.1
MVCSQTQALTAKAYDGFSPHPKWGSCFLWTPRAGAGTHHHHHHPFLTHSLIIPHTLTHSLTDSSALTYHDDECAHENVMIIIITSQSVGHSLTHSPWASSVNELQRSLKPEPPP